MPDILFARQEIFDRNLQVCAYEILYRHPEKDYVDVQDAHWDGNAATQFVMTHLFAEVAAEDVIGEVPAYINFTRDLILDKTPALLPKNRVVLELLESCIIDEDLIDAIRYLKHKGYKIALDDFNYDPSWEPLIELADIIKIDVLMFPERELEALITRLRLHFSGVFLAEKVENRAQFERCKALKFDLFQGFFLQKPEPVPGRLMSENKMGLMRILSTIHNPTASTTQIEELILSLPSLSYRVLRLANSVAMYGGRRFEELNEAIQQLGLMQIREWVFLILVSSVDSLPGSLLEAAVIRAHFCRDLAKTLGKANPSQAYTIGLFSTIDAILNEPLTELLKKIDLVDDVNDALLSEKGDLGAVLNLVRAYERADWPNVQRSGVSDALMHKYYLEAVHAARDFCRHLDLGRNTQP